MNMIDPFAPADSPAHPANWRADQRAVEPESDPELEGRELDEEVALAVDHLAATYRGEDEQTVDAATLVERAQAATPAGNAKRETWVEYYLAVIPDVAEADAPTVPNIKTQTETQLARVAAALAAVVREPEQE